MSVSPPAAETRRRVGGRAGQQDGRCRACNGWVVGVPPGTPWARGRCGNRSVLGVPGRRCPLYGAEQTFTWPAPVCTPVDTTVSRRIH